MTKNGGKNASKQHERNEAIANDSVHRRHLGELGITALFLVADFEFLWPENHFWALLLLAAGMGLLAWIELPKPMRLDCVALSFIVCGAAYWVIGPAPDVIVIGELQPGDIPRPNIICSGKPIPPDAAVVLMGGSVYFARFAGKVPLIVRGTGPILSVDYTPDGISIDANIYGLDGGAIATIKNNRFQVMEGRQAHAETPNISTLHVRDGENRMVLVVQFLNATTMYVSGVFASHGQPVFVGDDGIIGGNVTIKGACAHDFRPGMSLLRLP